MLGKLKNFGAENALIVFLIVLGLVNASESDAYLQLLVAPMVAGILDFLAIYARSKKVEVPKLGIITGLIIALVLVPSPLRASMAAVIAIGSKHAIAWRGRNIFNPAALGLVVTMLAFGIETTWWGGGHPIAMAGIIIALMVRRAETSISFLAVYAAVWSLVGSYTPFDYTIYFFAFVMVLEPVTSPFRREGKVLFGAAVALLTALVPFASVDALLASLLIANVFNPFFNKINFGRRKKSGKAAVYGKKDVSKAEKQPEQKEISRYMPVAGGGRAVESEAHEEPLFEEGEMDRTGREIEMEPSHEDAAREPAKPVKPEKKRKWFR